MIKLYFEKARTDYYKSQNNDYPWGKREDYDWDKHMGGISGMSGKVLFFSGFCLFWGP